MKNILQSSENFSKCNKNKTKLSSRCKLCLNEYHKGRRHLKKEYDRKFREIHKDRIKENKKLEYINNLEKVKTRSRNWYNNNKKYINNRNNKRYKDDINYRLCRNLRIRLNKAIKNKQKKGSAIINLGCSVEELIKYLESKFIEGMSWENYGLGSNKWNIDHIIPLSKVDLTDIVQLKLVCHYTNLQPMWQIDNIKKGNKYDQNY